MRELLNQHSYLLVSAFALLLTGSLTLRGGIRPRGLLALGFVVVALVMGQAAMRTGGGSVRSSQELEAAIGKGMPTLVVVYSDY